MRNGSRRRPASRQEVGDPQAAGQAAMVLRKVEFWWVSLVNYTHASNAVRSRRNTTNQCTKILRCRSER